MTTPKLSSLSLLHSIVVALLYLSLNSINGLPLRAEDASLWVLQKRSLSSYSNKPSLTRRAFAIAGKAAEGSKGLAGGKDSTEAFASLHTTVGIDSKSVYGNRELTSPAHTANAEDTQVIDKGNQVLGGHSVNGPDLSRPVNKKDGNSIASKWLANANPEPVKISTVGTAPTRTGVLSLAKKFESSRNSQASPTRDGLVKSIVKKFEANDVPKVPHPVEPASKKSVLELASHLDSPKSSSAVPKPLPAADTVIKDLGKKYGPVVDWKTKTKPFKTQPQTPSGEILPETERTGSVRGIVNRLNAENGPSDKAQAGAQAKAPQKLSSSPELRAPIQLVKPPKSLSTAENSDAVGKTTGEAKVLADMTNKQAPVGLVRSRVKDISDVSGTAPSKSLNHLGKGGDSVASAPVVEKVETSKQPSRVKNVDPIKNVAPVQTVEAGNNVKSPKPVSETIGLYNTLAKGEALNSKKFETLPVTTAQANVNADKRVNEIPPIAGAPKNSQTSNQVKEIVNQFEQLSKGELKSHPAPPKVAHGNHEESLNALSHIVEKDNKNAAQKESTVPAIEKFVKDTPVGTKGSFASKINEEFAQQSRSWLLKKKLPRNWQGRIGDVQKIILTFHLTK